MSLSQSEWCLMVICTDAERWWSTFEVSDRVRILQDKHGVSEPRVLNASGILHGLAKRECAETKRVYIQHHGNATKFRVTTKGVTRGQRLIEQNNIDHADL